jgi:hypothetical protein
LPATAYLSLITTSGKTCILNVNGTLNVGKLNVTSLTGGTGSNTAGTAPTISVASLGTMSVATSADFLSPTLSANVTGAGSFILGSGATISIGAPTGLEPVAGPVRTAIRTFDSGANYSYVGTAAQVTGSDLPLTVNNMTVNNAAGVNLGASTAINGVLSLTSGTLSLGANNLTIASLGSITGASATSYIVTDGIGKLTQSIGAGAAMLFPVGASTTSYDPATLTPTDATAVAVNVGTTLPDVTPSNYTYNAKAWDISAVSPSSTVVTLTPSTAVSTILRDVIGHYTGGAYDNVTATKSGNGYTATFSTFSPFVTGTTDMGTSLSNNLLEAVSFDGQTIHNNDNVDLKVFDATGRFMVSSNKNINMSNSSKGIYFVKSSTGTLKIALIK